MGSDPVKAICAELLEAGECAIGLLEQEGFQVQSKRLAHSLDDFVEAFHLEGLRQNATKSRWAQIKQEIAARAIKTSYHNVDTSTNDPEASCTVTRSRPSAN